MLDVGIDESFVVRRIEVAQHYLAFELGPKAEVELLDAGGEGKAGLPQPPLGIGLGPANGFLLEEALQEVRSHPQISSVSVVKLPPAGQMPPWFG